MVDQNKESNNTSEMVEVSKDKLTKMLERIDRLESAASKRQLAKYDSSHKETNNKIVRLRTLKGKVIIKWSNMILNTVERNPKTGYWQEDQVVNILYEDKTSEEMPYIIFARRHEFIPAIVISESKSSKTGKITYELKTDDGKKYSVLETFIN